LWDQIDMIGDGRWHGRLWDRYYDLNSSFHLFFSVWQSYFPLHCRGRDHLYVYERWCFKKTSKRDEGRLWDIKNLPSHLSLTTYHLTPYSHNLSSHLIICLTTYHLIICLTTYHLLPRSHLLFWMRSCLNFKMIMEMKHK